MVNSKENFHNYEDLILSIQIVGDYFDSYLYKGYLYLWTMENTIKVINWDELFSDPFFDKLGLKENFLFKLAFQRSDLLYGKDIKQVIDDPFFLQYFSEKLNNLNNKEIEIPSRLLEKYKKFEINIESFSLHSEIQFYYNNLFLALEDGIYVLSLRKLFNYLPKTKKGLYNRFKKISDLKAFSITTSYGDLYISSGNEGLFQINLGLGKNYSYNNFNSKEEIITEKHSSYTSQIYWDICNHSLTREGEDFLIKLKEKDDEPKRFRIKYLNKAERRIIPLTHWFKKKDRNLVIEYGRIFEISESTINVYKYNPKETNIESIGKLKVNNIISNSDTTVIDSKVTNFGVIIETNNDLLLLPSFYSNTTTNKIKPIKFNTKEAEITRWRAFPKSKFYENQLHLIYDDKLIIRSFLYDYFISQNNKLLGIRSSQSLK